MNSENEIREKIEYDLERNPAVRGKKIQSPVGATLMVRKIYKISSKSGTIDPVLSADEQFLLSHISPSPPS